MRHRTHLVSDIVLAATFMATMLLVPEAAEAARWYEDYDVAVENIEAGECSTEAIEALGAAVVDKSKPRRGVKTYAQRRIDYLPYYQLARAHLLCGNTDLAQQYLQRSRTFNIASEEELGPIEERLAALLAAQNVQPTVPPVDREALDNRLLAAKQNLEAARGALSLTDDSLGRATGLGTDNPNWTQQRDDSAGRIDSLAEDVDHYHEEGNLLALADAAHSATEIARSLDSLTIQINRAVEDREAALVPEHTAPAVVAQVKLSQTPTPIPAGTPRREATPSAPLITTDLRTAASAYLSGDYTSVTALLDHVRLEDSKAQAAALLLRAAAHISLASTAEGGPVGRVHAETARADILASKTLNPEIRPDPVFFPPPVTEMFEKVQPKTSPRPEENPS